MNPPVDGATCATCPFRSAEHHLAGEYDFEEHAWTCYASAEWADVELDHWCWQHPALRAKRRELEEKADG